MTALRALALILALSAFNNLCAPALAEKVVRIGMTVSDIPSTVGQPTQGTEGFRFVGFSIFEALVSWDLSREDVAAKIVPGLATHWSADPTNRKIWNFTLRQNVKFHDGSDWNAEVAVWNLDKLLKKDAPQYDPNQAAQAPGLPLIASYKASDTHVLTIETKDVNSFFPYILTESVSPAAHAGSRSAEAGRDLPNDLPELAPGKQRLTPRERLELVPHVEYWNDKRRPKIDRLVLHPMPDATSRSIALLSGQIDWAEAPPPDFVDKLKSAGFVIRSNVLPHYWPYQLNLNSGSPFADLRVRKAANLAVDRAGLVALLGGLARGAAGQVPPDHPWFGRPQFAIKYDPLEAKRLLAEAGFGPQRPVHAKILIASTGSGQMQPLPMNEFIQQNLADVGIKVEFEVMDWEALRARRRLGSSAPENRGISAINHSWATWDPYVGILDNFASNMRPPSGNNWGNFVDDEVDRLVAQARQAFDIEKQNELLGQIHSRAVDAAALLWVVHDTAPRAMSGKISGFVQPQSWFVDLTQIVVQ